MDDLVDWADVAAVAEMASSGGEDVDTVVCVLSSKYAHGSRDVHATIARVVRKYYSAGLTDGASKTCETCAQWTINNWESNGVQMRRTYCGRNFDTRAPGEFCSDHEPMKP